MRFRKSQATTLVAIILVLAVGAAVGGLTYKYVVKQREKTDMEVCKASVYLASQTKAVAGTPGPLVRVDCPRNSWVFDTESDAEINKEIAEALYYCIYASHAGKLNWAEAETISWLAGKSFCVHCGSFKFRGEAQKRYDGHSIFEYFASHNPPDWPKTYFEYFEDVTKDGDFYLDFNKWSDIDPSKTYVLFFARYNLPWAQEWMNRLGINPDLDVCLSGLIRPGTLLRPSSQCVGPAIATTNMAKGSLQSFVRFTPAENVKDCDVWLN